MNKVTSDLEDRVIYIDDDIKFSDTWEEHLQRMQTFLARVKESRLLMNNLNKCLFRYILFFHFCSRKLSGFIALSILFYYFFFFFCDLEVNLLNVFDCYMVKEVSSGLFCYFQLLGKFCIKNLIVIVFPSVQLIAHANLSQSHYYHCA